MKAPTNKDKKAAWSLDDALKQLNKRVGDKSFYGELIIKVSEGNIYMMEEHRVIRYPNEV